MAPTIFRSNSFPLSGGRWPGDSTSFLWGRPVRATVCRRKCHHQSPANDIACSIVRLRAVTDRITHLAALHDSATSSNTTIGRICPSFAFFLQTGHSCFKAMEFLIHCTLSVFKKFGSLGGDAHPPTNRSSVHTPRKLVPYRTPCISCRSTTSRDVLVPFAGSQRGLRYRNPANFAGGSSSTWPYKKKRSSPA